MRLLSRLLARGTGPVGVPPAGLGTPAAEPRAELDDELLDLLRRHVNSAIKMDLVAYFHDNPYAADSARTLAMRLGRDVSLAEMCLADLERDGLLRQLPAGRPDGPPLFRLSSAAELRVRITRLVALYRSAAGAEVRAAIRDISIAATVQATIVGSTRVSALDMAVRCSGGTVVLDGRVNTPNERAELALICERLSQSRFGIRGLENRIAVEARRSGEDHGVCAQVQRALVERGRLPCPDSADSRDAGRSYVNVAVLGGVVYLTGLVESSQDRSRAAQISQSVAGVADVVNWLDVEAHRERG